MGALPPGTPWIPEDDLLLKNAVEAGASLESLAKGAVEFSRRFTLRELQDRWHSLLYDPITSAEAAERMIEFERSAPNLSSKSNRVDSSKETKGLGKRKIETVRKRYYALRKKLCNEQLNQGDLSFLVAPGDDCFIGGAGAPGQSNMLGDPMANHFGLEEANFNDLHHVFPQVVGNSAQPCGAGGFHLGQQETLEVAIDQNNVHRNAPPIAGSNMGMDENYARIGQMDMPKEQPGPNVFDANALEANTACNSKDIMCTDFGGNAIFNSPMSDCDTAFHHLQYTSTPPAMPDWRPIEDISVPEMPADVSSGGNNVQTGDAFCIPGDCDAAKGTSECVEPESNDQISCSGLRNSTGCTDGYFAELSASLLNFSDEEMLIGRKDAIDKTYFDGLSSLLLNSPDDVTEDKIPNMPETKEATIQGACPDIVKDKGPRDPNNSGNTPLRDGSVQCDTETQMSSSTVNNPPFPEFHDGVIFCALNTEDPEIPCNDDVVFPSKPRPASANKRTQNEANNSAVAGKDSVSNPNNDKGSGTTKRDPKRVGESQSAASETRGSDIGKKHAMDELGVKFDASRGESLNGRNPTSSYPGPSQTSSAVNNESSELTMVRQPGCSNTDKPGYASELGHLQTGSSGITQDGQTPSTIRNQDCHVLGPADPMVTEPGGESLMSDPEEQFSESDADIPYYSDIESMILDMDLGPDDQDSFSLGEVAKYQHEDAKRAIIRLEQTAHSYMQRAIASHGAFAILYGRHSKHYIKKPEVLLGRGTDDIIVDIDLGREGRANRVSRRQAIIKMDKDGTFSIKNLGRCSIYVNSKEVGSGLCQSLHSNCLIEIRGLPFIFETNQARVKQYLNNAALKLEANGLNG